MLLSFFKVRPPNATTQTYTTTTESKHCGACGHDVAANSTVGMTCPYCGVTWGRENTSTHYSTAEGLP